MPDSANLRPHDAERTPKSLHWQPKPRVSSPLFHQLELGTYFLAHFALATWGWCFHCFYRKCEHILASEILIVSLLPEQLLYQIASYLEAIVNYVKILFKAAFIWFTAVSTW